VLVQVSPSGVGKTSLTATPSGTYTVIVTSAGGFSSLVSLSTSALPTGVTGDFYPSTVTPSNLQQSVKSILTICTAQAGATGTFLLTITGVSDSLTHSFQVTLTIIPVPRPPVPKPTIYEKEFREEGHSATFIITVKVENGTDRVPYPTKLVWKECNEYNITVQIEVVFNGSNRIIINQMNATLLNSKKQIEQKSSSRIRDYELNYTVTLSPEFEFTLHPRKGIVKIEPCAAFTLVIEIKIYEYYEGKMRSWPSFREEVEMTICS